MKSRCEYCGKDIEQIRKAGPKRRFCNNARCRKYFNMKLHLIDGVCKECGKEFETNSRTQKYCSQQCSGKVYGQKRIEKAIQEIAQGQKQCRKCNEVKSLDQFSKSNSNAAGYDCYCKSCNSKIWQEYISNPENRERRNQRKRERQSTSEAKNKIKIWNQNYKSRRNELERKRVREDSNFRIKKRINTLIYLYLKKRNGKHPLIIGRTEAALGYTIEELKAHLKREAKKKGLIWQDYLDGKLWLEHIIPVSAFNFKTINDIDFKRCWALKNLTLLTAEENMKKHARLKRHFQPSFIFNKG